MNTSHTKDSPMLKQSATSRFSILKWSLTIIAIVLLFAAGWGAWWWNRESAALERLVASSKKFEPRRSQLTLASFSNGTLNESARKDTQTWLDIRSTLRWGKDLDGFPSLTELITSLERMPPKGQRNSNSSKAFERAQAYLLQMAPIRTAIENGVHQMGDAAIPWNSQLLGSADSPETTYQLVHQYLTLDFWVAIHSGDHARAIEDLKTLFKFEAGTSDETNAYFFQLATDEFDATSCLLKSLEVVPWTGEELVQLQDLTPVKSAAEIDWGREIETLKFYLLSKVARVPLTASVLERFTTNYGSLLPSEAETIVQRIENAIPASTSLLSEQVRFRLLTDDEITSVSSGQFRMGRASLEKIYFLSAQNQIGRLAAAYDRSRFCKIAIGLQLYRNRNGTFPKLLDQLSEVGVPESELLQASGEQFGYSVSNVPRIDGIAAADVDEVVEGPSSQQLAVLDTVQSQIGGVDPIRSQNGVQIYPVVLSIHLK